MDKQSKKETHLKGLLGETELTLRLLKNGWNLYKPLDQNSRIDLLAEKRGKFKRIQVKYCTPYKGCLRIELEHPMRNTGPYSENEVDEIGVYDAENQNCYLIPLKDILPRGEIWLRVSSLVKKQERNINWAKKYQI
jgi:hypothetical protein